MKIAGLLITIIAAAITLTSCKKYLDIKPKGYVIPQTVEDFERLLNNAAIARNLPNHLDMLTDDYFVQGATNTSLNIENSAESRIYQWQAELYATPDDMQYYAYWNLLYANAYQYNAAINGIETATGGTPARKKVVAARARLGRAITYWYLANLYAKPYNSQSATTDPGVPIVISNDLAQELPGRGSVKETFDFVLNDLKTAIPDLPASALDPYQLTKAAGFAMLARTCLMMADYQQAGKAADSALAYKSQLNDYNNAYTEGPNGAFLPKSNGPYANMLSDPENIFVQHYSYTRGMAYKNISPTTVTQFSKDDLRRIFITADTATNTVTHRLDTVYTFMGKTSYNVNISFSVPEMILIRAECAARQDQLAAAMNDLNTLRRNRIRKAAYQDLQAADRTSAIRLILNERRRELLYKGARWFDMRRLNNDPVFGFTAYHLLADGTAITLTPNSNRYVLRIPNNALTTSITQNP